MKKVFRFVRKAYAFVKKVVVSLATFVAETATTVYETVVAASAIVVETVVETVSATVDAVVETTTTVAEAVVETTSTVYETVKEAVVETTTNMFVAVVFALGYVVLQAKKADKRIRKALESAPWYVSFLYTDVIPKLVYGILVSKVYYHRKRLLNMLVNGLTRLFSFTSRSILILLLVVALAFPVGFYVLKDLLFRKGVSPVETDSVIYLLPAPLPLGEVDDAEWAVIAEIFSHPDENRETMQDCSQDCINSPTNGSQKVENPFPSKRIELEATKLMILSFKKLKDRSPELLYAISSSNCDIDNPVLRETVRLALVKLSVIMMAFIRSGKVKLSMKEFDLIFNKSTPEKERYLRSKFFTSDSTCYKATFTDYYRECLGKFK